MKKTVLLSLLLIAILSSSLQSMQSCQLCALMTEYKNTHQTLYNSITCLFCNQEIDNDGISYELLTSQDYTFRIHDAQELNCVALMKNSFTQNSTHLCDSCTKNLSLLERDDNEHVSKCHLKCVSCCVAWLPCFLCYFWDECSCKECPFFYGDAWKEACCCKK